MDMDITNDHVIHDEAEKADIKEATEVKTHSEQADEERGYWGRHIEFVLATVGFCIGLGIFLRFPYLRGQTNCGGAFFWPLVLVGVFCFIYCLTVFIKYCLTRLAQACAARNLNPGPTEQILSSVKTRTSKPKFDVKACGVCLASCVLDSLFVIFELMRLFFCRTRFVKEIERRLQDPKFGKLSFDPDRCSLLLKTLFELGLVKLLCEVSIDGNLDEALKEQIDELKKSGTFLALLALGYSRRDVGHCMVMLCARNTSVYDAQSQKWWPESHDDIKDVEKIQIYEINKEELKKWLPICGMECCASELECLVPKQEIGCVHHSSSSG